MPATIIISEHFTGLAGGLNGHSPTPTNSPSTHWSALLANNLLIDGDGNCVGPNDDGVKPIDVLNVGTVDYVVSVEFSAQGMGGNDVRGGIAFRVIDANNFYVFDVASTGQARLRRCTAGVFATLGSATFTFTIATHYILSIAIASAVAVLKINGAIIIVANSLTQGANSTLAGLWCDNIGGGEVPQFNNFEVTTNTAGEIDFEIGVTPLHPFAMSNGLALPLKLSNTRL